MPLVQTQGGLPYHVEDFGEGCERSVKGALHFLPSSTKSITKDELQHIQSKHKDFAKALRVVMMDDSKSRGAPPKVEAKGKPQPKVERASHRLTKAQRKAAGTEAKVAKPKVETPKPIETVAAPVAEEPMPMEDEDKTKGKKKGWNK